ncbi:TPA: hypothetical protein ACS54F_001669 [Salmonella enterica]|uniref:Uncharacterized protein n=1 Tax=Salmonella enterica TaxID=28901 RepID=A0A8E9PML6_SALER|nr:hypothetical protein [Salmonella enterica]EBS0277537.1 hypothetical protein [Salmonella enterica subsp. enterica serovar Waycross]ECC9658500.1 hypothetical protein [Salmonella enterica subsp. enterica]EAM3124419.1 hypothetical protein [Salmonella enterica]EAO9245543.1 hypothetical protein [Salmonella enterica]
MSYKYVSKHGCDVALRMGYKECPDENAYGDAYYIKDGLKWIFNITGLKKRLGVYSDDDLRKQNYDVDTYYRVENQQEEIADDEMQSLYHNLAVEEGEPVYLEGGMYLYPDGSIR